MKNSHIERQKTGETGREESGDMMFSLTSSLIRPVSAPNTTVAIRPDSTPTPTIPTRTGCSNTRVNEQSGGNENGKGGGGMPENRHSNKKQKEKKSAGKTVFVPSSCLTRCSCKKVAMTARGALTSIPRGSLWKHRTHTSEQAGMSRKLIEIITLLPQQLLHFNVDSNDPEGRSRTPSVPPLLPGPVSFRRSHFR